MRVLLAGGGTGGHINPALAIASIIQAHDPEAEFLFAGTPNGMEARLVPQSGYQLASIEVAGFQRKISLNNIKRNAKAVYYLAKSGKRARQIVSDFKPDIAIGTGGYVAGPVIRMAAKMGVPCAIHEQNAFPGVTNKMLSQNVDHVMLTVKEALEYMEFDCPYTVTGLPVRSGISHKTKEEARRELGFDDNLCILSFGGSLGAGCINEVMEEMIPWHVRQDLKINHIHGYGGMGRDTFPAAMEEAGIPMRSKRLRITEYINDMDTCLAAADLVICRAGASTLAELEAAGKASILIPSPIVAGNHQFHNANVLGKAGAAIVIEQKNVTIEGMIGHVKKLYEKPERLAEMSRRAASLQITDTPDRIWAVVEELLQKGKERQEAAALKESGEDCVKKKMTLKESLGKAKDGFLSCVPQIFPEKEDTGKKTKTPETASEQKDAAEETAKE
ncbi:MAG: undecaprenyldiphospho-muramoylpentapeptide beta-N-acetylglucosaminyltransferase [Ruminococcus sp.]|nr:undecaprenyldiphospho-muramoylpentapeptide beta-N-acetylglucosaminyltransferase [Ruminococcus sp.]